MKILLTGGTGFVGRELGIMLTGKGHEIHCLSRVPEIDKNKTTFPANFYKWDGVNELPPQESLQGIDAVIHLAGENIGAKRWSASYKKSLVESRVKSTQNIFSALKQYNIKPSVFIGASAIGYYGDRGDTSLNENSEKGEGFLSDLCEKWEQASQECEPLNIRRCILRFGLVISELGGVLDEMVQLSHRGMLSRLGLSANQWMSWVELNDLCRLILWCLENNQAQGIYNAISNTPIQNKDFVKAINQTLKNSAFLPVPIFLLKIVLGERSILVLSSQKLNESRSVKEGFVFEHNNFTELMQKIFPNWVSGEYLFKTKLWMPYHLENVFEFFKNENNLEKITPSSLGFQIISKSTASIQKGTLIKYKIKIHGFPFRWITKIAEFDEPNSFTDIQLKGPYQKWEHTHSFQKCFDGTLMEDKVIFKLPFSLLGRIVAFSFVVKDVKNIFKYRTETIAALAPKQF